MLDRQRAVVDAGPPAALVEGWVTLVGHDLASDALLVGAADLAKKRGTGMTMHLSPTSSDPERYLARTGRRPVVHLDHLGVLGPHLLLGPRRVARRRRDRARAVERRTAIAYCPWAYLRLGQGVTRAGRHAEIVERGGRVALGCDASNAGDVDRHPARRGGRCRHRPRHAHRPERFGAHEAFELATIAGAEAIGMADRIGSLEPGKQADIVVHRTDGWGWSPRGDVGAAARVGHRRPVGARRLRRRQPVVRDGRCVTVDTDAVWHEAAGAQQSLLERAGIIVPHRWPQIDAR